MRRTIMMLGLWGGIAAAGGGASGCGGGAAGKSAEQRLTRKAYLARMQRCAPELHGAHRATILRWMKERAETKALAARVDTLVTGKDTKAMFEKVPGMLQRIYVKLLEGMPSEEAFQKAVKEGPRKEVVVCFAKKGCGALAACVSGALTIPILAGLGQDKALLKLVTKPSLHDQMMATTSFTQAVALARAAMTDEQGALSKGAVLLALWGAKHGLTIGALKALPESDYKSVMKDADEERGRLICTTGRIIEIHAERTPAGKIYSGGMWMGWGYSKVARFIAVGTTRGVTESSRARFCGVVIGRYSYKNSGGGSTHAVQLVGVFDLVGNR